MNWYNSKVDGNPMHKDEVLISVNGIYHVAQYDAKNNIYVSKRNKKLTFKPSEVSIYWAKIVPPDNETGLIKLSTAV